MNQQKREYLGIVASFLLRDQSVVVTWLSREPEGLIASPSPPDRKSIGVFARGRRAGEDGCHFQPRWWSSLAAQDLTQT